MRALVTGGAGFIGSHVVDRLVKRGDAVTVLDSLEPQVHPAAPDHLNPAAKYVTRDVRDRAVLAELLPEHEVVYHLAAQVGVAQSMYQPERYVDHNTLATARLLDVLVNTRHSVRKLVVAASMSSYGEGRYLCATCGPVDPRLRPEEQLRQREWEVRCPSCAGVASPAPTPEVKPLDPTSIYAMTKRHQEEMCLAVGAAYGIPTVALRFFNVYGPRQSLSNPYTGVAAIFSARIKNGEPPVVFEDGRQSRDFVHVSDVARAVELAGTRGSSGDVFNVGTGTPRSILEVAEALVKLHGAALAPEVRGAYRAGDVRHCFADVSRISSKLEWRAQVPFEEGLGDLVGWSAARSATDRFAQAEAELERHGLVRR